MTGDDSAELATIVETQRLTKVEATSVIFFLLIKLPSVLAPADPELQSAHLHIP